MFYETQALIVLQFSLGENISRHILIWKVSCIFQSRFPTYSVLCSYSQVNLLEPAY